VVGVTRVLVCGGRDYGGSVEVFAALDRLHALRPIALVIHGDATGADEWAAWWADSRGVEERPYPAEWHLHGRGAGPRRNQHMLADGRPDVVVAFPGGRGTADMVARAQAAGCQ
jgi:hypothetical protein